MKINEPILLAGVFLLLLAASQFLAHKLIEENNKLIVINDNLISQLETCQLK